jgi:hypothetical protein
MMANYKTTPSMIDTLHENDNLVGQDSSRSIQDLPAQHASWGVALVDVAQSQQFIGLAASGAENLN